MGHQSTLNLNRDVEELTVLSFGGGQDSSALIEMYLRDQNGFRARFAPGKLVVVMSDTGDEFPQTYKHALSVKKRCEAQGIEFHFLTPDLGYHSRSWPSLIDYYRSKNTIGSKAFPKTCTDNLKIQPIYRWLEEWVSTTYRYPTGRGKLAIRSFAQEHGKINVMIGIAQGEERRVRNAKMSPGRWYDNSIQPVYPLIDLGMDRAACQDLLHSFQVRVVPSNCRRCPFVDLIELEYLRRFHPEDLAEWIELEANKLASNSHMDAVQVTNKRTGKTKTENRNYGVFVKKYLPEMVQKAREKYGSWSDHAISNHRYSHGHCVASSY